MKQKKKVCKNGSCSSSFGGRNIKKMVETTLFLSLTYRSSPSRSWWWKSTEKRSETTCNISLPLVIKDLASHPGSNRSVRAIVHVLLFGIPSRLNMGIMSSCLEDHPRTCKWLGSPAFTSHETAIWKGNGDLPWLISTYESWDDSGNFYGNGISIFSGQQNKLPILEGIWSYIHKALKRSRFLVNCSIGIHWIYPLGPRMQSSHYIFRIQNPETKPLFIYLYVPLLLGVGGGRSKVHTIKTHTTTVATSLQKNLGVPCVAVDWVAPWQQVQRRCLFYLDVPGRVGWDQRLPGWWFQPPWKIWVKMGIFPK